MIKTLPEVQSSHRSEKKEEGPPQRDAQGQHSRNWRGDTRRGPAQDVPFFYMPSHLSEQKSCKSIISTNISVIFIFK